MKKFLMLILLCVFLNSCLPEDNEPNYALKYVPITEVVVPDNFIFGSTNKIKVKYKLTNTCLMYHNLYYKKDENKRIVAVIAKEIIDKSCTQSTTIKELEIPVIVKQTEKYFFKFWNGKDSSGKDLYIEKEIPVIIK